MFGGIVQAQDYIIEKRSLKGEAGFLFSRETIQLVRNFYKIKGENSHDTLF